mgnify:FL=1
MLVVRAPLRLSFLGGGSDIPAFCGAEVGRVLSVTISPSVFVCLMPHFEGGVRLSYTKTEVVAKPEDLEHDLVRMALIRCGVTDVEIATIADLPGRGLGLGSSAATTVGTLLACLEYSQHRWEAEKIAREASMIEIEDLGRNIGYQDQWAVAVGGLALYEFGPGSKAVVTRPRVTPDTMSELESWCALYWLGGHRDSDIILTEQSNRVPATKSYLARLADLAGDGAFALEAGNIPTFCGYMQEAWEAKKHLAAGVTNPRIDALCQAAEKAGAAAWKICGAGGGGSFLVLRSPKKAAEIDRAMKACVRIPFRFERWGAQVVYDGRWRDRNG